MKNAHVAALVAIILSCAAPARAQVFGQFTGAETLPVNGRLFGAYIQSSENAVGLLGQLRLSFYPGVDFGFQGGFTRQDLVRSNTTTVRLGTDFKVGVMKPTDARPISVAAGAALGIETGDNFHILTLEPSVVGSRAFHVGESGSVTPYARIGLAFSSVDVGDQDDTDLSVPIRIGGDFRLSPGLGIVAELQLQLSDSFNDNVGLAAGVNLPF